MTTMVIILVHTLIKVVGLDLWRAVVHMNAGDKVPTHLWIDVWRDIHERQRILI